jgi:DNA-binding response OmpR family regulator
VALTRAPTSISAIPDRAARILLVDDEQSIQTLLSYPLRRDGYEVVQAKDGLEALEKFEEQPFDLVVLDVMLPRLDGLEVCRRLRSASSVPIIMLTAKSEEIDKVVGLELGADDYITKPFSLREFSSRIKAALRRSEMSSSPRSDEDEESLEVDGLRIDFLKRSTRVDGQDAGLTFVEFEILSTLARSPGRVFTRDMLLAGLWGDSAYRDPRTIDVHIRHLREKIEPDPKDPRYLFTVRGVGYRFRDTEP